MSAQSYSVRGGASRLWAYVVLLRYHATRTDQFAEHDWGRVMNELIPDLERYGRAPLLEACVLEIGSGQRPGGTMVLNAYAREVIGIDYDLIEVKMSPAMLWRLARRNGVERAAKTLFRHTFFDRRYYRRLERSADLPLRRRELDLRAMDACALEFPDESFDAIVSNAVFEHIHDVPAAAAEMHRVLKPKGIAHIGVHLYPSLSGGHRMEWAYPESDPSRTVPPWDHLRQQRFPAHVYLNELRERDYLAAFGAYFELVEKGNTWEGRDLLNDEIRAELLDYDEDDLLKRSLNVVLRKAGSGGAGEQSPAHRIDPRVESTSS